MKVPGAHSELVPEYGPGEQPVYFVGDYGLEGRFGWPEKRTFALSDTYRLEIDGGVVVAHPYPPGGANMDLPVVYRIAKECRKRHLASLRFNFRSVGQSRGTFSGTEEYRDVMAAVAYMTEALDPEHRIDSDRMPLGLAGWSFGGVQSARAAAELPEVRALALVGFPVHWEELPADTLDRLRRFQGSLLAVCSENDHHGTPDEVAQALGGAGLRPRIEVIRGADHYLKGRDREVGELVAGFFADVCAEALTT